VFANELKIGVTLLFLPAARVRAREAATRFPFCGARSPVNSFEGTPPPSLARMRAHA